MQDYIYDIIAQTQIHTYNGLIYDDEDDDVHDVTNSTDRAISKCKQGNVSKYNVQNCMH